jgi:Tol biopolymer transport system component/DNA-binding winged helix-turn-helix (wHTH) protein
MAAVRGKSTVWRFDRVVVDTGAFRVTIDGVPRDLEPKSFRLLQFLIENRERALSKEEIFQAVWSGTFVSDNALTRAVAQIRKAIGDDPRQPRCIETIPTIGYRFIAAVEESETAGEPPSVDVPGSHLPKAIFIAAGVVFAVLLATGLAYWIHPQSSPRSIPGFLPVQFSSSAGLDMGAAFSPDGNLVAYASDKRGAFEIFVRSFDAAARELQLTNDGNQNFYPSFSRDGRWIAYASTRRRGIYRVPAIGGPVQRLTDFGVGPVWSPDNRTIVFRSNGSASLSTTDYYWPEESTLWMVPSEGGEPTQITGINGRPPGGQSFPSFSPDGSEIHFVNQFKGEAGIWTYRFGDRSFHQRFSSAAFQYSNATFAPDGTRMWFVNSQLNGNIGIWQLPLHPGTLTPAGEPRPLSNSPFAVPRDLALSADGKRLAFTAVVSHSAILAQPIGGDRSAPVSLTNETTYRYAVVRSSPDGTRVMYTAFPWNGLPHAWMVHADGSQPTPVGPAGLAGFFSGISGDNGRAFVAAFGDSSRRATGRLVAHRFADGASSGLSELPPRSSHWICASDCGVVAFHSDLDGHRRVYVKDTATGSVRVVDADGADVGFPSFSRDNRWMSVEIRRRITGGDDLAILPTDGGPLEVLLRSDEPTFASGWMPDNDRILFAGFRDGVWNAYTLSRSTRKVEQLTSYNSPRIYVRYIDWLAGDRIVYEFNETKGNIFVTDLSR